jgi:hypothetical protein
VTNEVYTVLNGNLLECGGGRVRRWKGIMKTERRRRIVFCDISVSHGGEYEV